MATKMSASPFYMADDTENDSSFRVRAFRLGAVGCVLSPRRSFPVKSAVSHLLSQRAEVVKTDAAADAATSSRACRAFWAERRKGGTPTLQRLHLLV